MNRKLACAISGLALGMSLTAVAAQPAYASGCVSITDIWYTSDSTYADVKNNCSYTVSASVDVPFMSDPPCANISGYATRTYRTSGSSWFDPRDAYEC